MKRLFLLFFLFILITPVEGYFDTWSFSGQIKAGQKFVWLEYNQYYSTDDQLPPPDKATNTTLVVTQTPGDIEVRAMVDDSYFDYYVNGTKSVIVKAFFTNNILIENYIIPTRINGSVDYFEWHVANNEGKSWIEGDLFYYSENVTSAFSNTTTDFDLISYVPSGVMLYVGYRYSNHSGELISGFSKFLTFPKLDIPDLIENDITNNDNTSEGAFQVSISLGFTVIGLMVIVSRWRRSYLEVLYQM